MGTMLRLTPPWELLDRELTEGLPAERVEAAFRREMAYYAANATEAGDRDSLRALRQRCAEILSEGLGVPVAVEAMMAAIRFEPFEDAKPALAELRARGLALACVSNWDYELPLVLERVGLAGELDAIVSSASVGAPKPDAAIFERALGLLGRNPAETVHVGDSAVDIEGAAAAGVEPLLIDREGNEGPPGVTTIASLREIGEHLRG